MKIQIVSERRTGVLIPSPAGLGWFRSVYYVIKKVKIGRKIVPNVTFAEIERCVTIDEIYTSTPKRGKEQATLSIEIDGKIRIYEVLKYSGKQLGDIRTVNLEVK